MIELVKAHPLFMTEENMPILELEREDYEIRIARLVERIRARNLTHMVIYGDREHFSNVEYFTRYDSRFEETLLIVDAQGKLSIVLGNEGMGYSQIIPVEIDRYLYQHFSLQGQPRQKLRLLSDILRDTGICEDSRLGIVGIKYFEEGMIDSNPEQTYDLPQYILDAIKKACPNIVNATMELTGAPDGIRMRLYTAREIAWAESAGNRVASVMQRLMKNLREGIRECELPQLAQVGFDPTSVHPMLNFGDRSVALGLRSPGTCEVVKGTPGGLCYGLRGNLTCRVSVLASCLEEYAEHLKPYFESFYKVYYQAVAAWYETAKIGATGGQLHKAVMDLIGGEEFGVTLNAGHCTATEEWPNAISYEGSTIPLVDGSFMQVDIIASGPGPVHNAICEDAVVIAGEGLREELRQQYPETYARIQNRRQVMKDVLGIHLHEDVLPMSNLNGVYYPFLLNTDVVFGKR